VTIHIYNALKGRIHTQTSNHLSVGKWKELYLHVKYKKNERLAETLCGAVYNQPFKGTKYWLSTIYIHITMKPIKLTFRKILCEEISNLKP
jgi:hypothetical protein